MERRVDLAQALEGIQQGFALSAERLTAARHGAGLCAEDCGACCMVNVPMASSLEIHVALAKLQVPTAAIQRAKDWLTHKHTQATLYPREQPRIVGGPVGNANLTSAEVAMAMSEKAALAATACPMLAPDKRCMMWEGRPFTCRAYSDTTAPDLFCERPKSDAELAMPGMFQVDDTGGLQLEKLTQMLHAEANKPEVGLANFGTAGFLPTILVKLYDQPWFDRKVAAGEIALAKLVMVSGQYPAPLSQASKEGYIAFLRQNHPEAVTDGLPQPVAVGAATE